MIGLDTAIRTTRVTAIKDAIDAGSGAGKLKLYNGTRPATGGSATTLLGTLTCSDPCGTVTSGELTFSALTPDTSADASGTATWARLTTSADAFVADLSVGVTGSGADLELNTVTIVSGGTISVSSLVIADGNI